MSVCVTSGDPLHYADIPPWPPVRVDELEAKSLSEATERILTADAVADVIKPPGSEDDS